MLCCGGGGDGPYTLTIDSTAGAVVTVNNATIPGRAFLTYDAGTAVSLNATRDSDYEFAQLTGDVRTVDGVLGSGTITVMTGDYCICTHFGVSTAKEHN
jgi:hypothetical protein